MVPALIFQSLKISLADSNKFIYYFCGVIELMRVNRKALVKWLHF